MQTNPPVLVDQAQLGLACPAIPGATCRRFIALALLGMLVASCTSSQLQQATAPSASASKAASRDIGTQIREVDLSPRGPQRVLTGGAPHEVAQEAVTYHGDGRPAYASRKGGAKGALAQAESDPVTTGSLGSSSDKGYEMNFENTPIPTVAKAVLGDILGVGYTIDPRVQGTVSLASGRAVARKDLLYVLESALRVSNVALIREGAGYRLVPSPDAVGSGAIDGAHGPDAGFGISVVPLQFVSAQTLNKLLENFAARPGMVRADPSRNLIIIQGNAADRRSAIDTALNFDADWMQGQSVGIYPVSNSTLEPVIAELERIIDSGEGGLSQNVVKLQPIARQNSILVVSRRPEYLKTVSTWINRLDRSGGGGTGVKVYRMRYGDARQVAAVLNDIFLGGGSSQTTDSPSNQLAPGGGAVATSSDRPSAIAQTQNPNSPVRVASGPGASPAFDNRFSDAFGGRSQPNANQSVQTASGRGGPNGPLLPNVRISPDVINNALLIYSSTEHYRVIERTIHQLDQPQLQVAIDATIAEVTLNDDLRYGVQFFLKSKDVGLPTDVGSVINSAAKSAILNKMLPGFNFLVGTDAQPRLIIDALHAVTDVKILSTPSVVVVDNQAATLQVGDTIPVATRSAQAVETPTAPIVNNIDYRNTGVILRVAPRINANGNVLLDVEQEISAVAKTSTAETLTPTVSQRRVRSSIAVASGQTVLLGGLISERQERGRSGIPGLMNVPGFGEWFSQNTGAFQRTELIIFIRPQIIRNGVDANRVAAELRSKMRGVFPEAPPPPPPKRPPPALKRTVDK